MMKKHFVSSFDEWILSLSLSLSLSLPLYFLSTGLYFILFGQVGLCLYCKFLC